MKFNWKLRLIMLILALIIGFLVSPFIEDYGIRFLFNVLLGGVSQIIGMILENLD